MHASMRTLRWAGVGLALAGVSACESNAHKAERLMMAVTHACAEVDQPGGMAPTDVTFLEKRATCDAAKHEYAAFLSGR